MAPNNHTKIIQVLAGIIIAIVGFMWIDLNGDLDSQAQRLRQVELNQLKLLTMLNVSPAAAITQPESQLGCELLISHTEVSTW